MNASATYIEAAQAGVADALKTAAVSGVAPPSYTLGVQAVRNRGYKSRCNSKYKEADPTLSACYILGSIHDKGIENLMKVVNPFNQREQRMDSLLQLPNFTANGDSIASTKRKVAEACDDILLSFHATVMVDKSLHLQSLLENCIGQLVQAKENEKHALELSKKQRQTIKALLESSSRTEERRCRVELSRVDSEKLVHVLAAQMNLEEKSSAALSPTSSVSVHGI